MPDPTPRELLLHIENIVKQVENDRVTNAAQNAAILTRLDNLGATLASAYVPKGEYIADRRGDDRRFKELESDAAISAGFKRQVLAGIAVSFLAALFGIVLTLAQVGMRVG